MKKPQFSLRTIEEYPLRDEGFSFSTVDGKSGSIHGMEELENIARMGGPTMIIGISRRLLAQSLKEEILQESKEYVPITEDTMNLCFDRWNPSAGTNIGNAIPHRHDEINVHASIEYSSVGTAFFRTSTVIEGVRRAIDLAYRYQEEELGNTFEAVLRKYEDGGSRDDVYDELFTIAHSNPASQFYPVFANEIQRTTRRLQGQYDVSLGKKGVGMTIIPKDCPHSRSMTTSPIRNHLTAWRYMKYVNV